MDQYCHDCAFFESVMCDYCESPYTTDVDVDDYVVDIDDVDPDPYDWWFPYDCIPDET